MQKYNSGLYIDAMVKATKMLQAEGYSVNGQKPKLANGAKPGQAAIDIRVTQSFLRSETPITSGSTQYQMNVKYGVPNIGNSGILPQEQRLNDQDVFFCCELGFYVVNRQTLSGQFQYLDGTFPSALYNGSGGCNTYEMAGLWVAGKLSVQVNNETLTPAWMLKQHYCPNVGQANNNYPSPSTTSGLVDQLDGQDYLNDGRVMTWPNWIVNGGNNNQYIITYPVPTGTMGIGTLTGLYLVLEWHGYLAQNASSIMYNKHYSME